MQADGEFERNRSKRVVIAEDSMGVAVFLISDASTMMTKAALVVDGRWTAV
jgi:NAD(P)-dependent dehydrogenase (short-subunit alcohol dehydrogenase family)